MKETKTGVKNTAKNTEQVPRVEGLSMNVHEAHVDALRAVCPGVFSEGKVDFDKLTTALAGHVADEGQERYGLSWAGKPKCFAEIAKQTTGTLVPVRDESINFDTSDNVFIEGENLEVLKILQRSYYGKVKMIYIDPPYNTGKDFVYHDSFQRSGAEENDEAGLLDESGHMKAAYKQNSKDSGRYHSNWLNMMYPRLYLARNLLRDDGVIFISIDDNEVHNLRMLMNEIFGEENFVESIIWQKKYSPQNDATYFSDMHDYVLCYAKQKKQNKNDPDGWKINLLERTDEQNARYANPDKDIRGNWKAADMSVKTYSSSYDYEITAPSGRVVSPPKGRAWSTSREQFEVWKSDGRIWFGKDGNNVPSVKIFLSEVQSGIVPLSLWMRTDVGDNQEAMQELKTLFGGYAYFDTPKPSRLVSRMLSLATRKDSNDIILDFFAGSGTTAHAVLELNKEDGGNRKFICVQIPEETPEGSEARKAGYATIADITKARIRKVLERIQGVPLDAMQQEPEERRLLQGSTLNADSQGRTLAAPQRIQGVPLDAGAAPLGFKVFKTAASNFNIWRTREFASGEELQQALVDHIKEVKQATPENKLYEILIKAGYDLNTKIEKRMVPEEQPLLQGLTLNADSKGRTLAAPSAPREYFVVYPFSKETPLKAEESPLKTLVVCLSEYMDKKIVDAIIAENPKQVISLDSAFDGKDELKVNMYLSLRNKKIEFSVV